jgi:hypothetical protein
VAAVGHRHGRGGDRGVHGGCGGGARYALSLAFSFSLVTFFSCFFRKKINRKSASSLMRKRLTRPLVAWVAGARAAKRPAARRLCDLAKMAPEHASPIAYRGELLS